MKEETKILIKVIIGIVLLVGLAVSFVVWSNQIIERHSLDDYGCEDIDRAITFDYCLQKYKQKANIFLSCYSLQNMYVYYQLNCMEDNGGKNDQVNRVDE